MFEPVRSLTAKLRLVKKLSKFIKSPDKYSNARKALLFVNGFLVASLLYFYTEDAYEKKLFETLALSVNNNNPVAESKIDTLLLNSLHLTHHLAENRAEIFESRMVNSFKSTVIHPVTYDLMTVNGACGSYSYILSRLLNELKIPNRVAQMKVNGKYGGHIVVEAKTSQGWVVLDALYNLYFKKASGALASFNDVQNNWDYYRSQVPSNYDLHYKYDGVRYTNWNKIPILMPVIKKVLEFTIGKRAVENFSLRIYLLRKFHLLFNITFIIYLLLLAATIRNYMRRNRMVVKKYFPFFFPNKKISAGNGSGTEIVHA